MKHFAKIIAFGAMVAGSSAHAQQATTTQEAVLGASGDPVYTVQVAGANGVVYNCLPDLIVRNGVTVRQCRRVGAGGDLSLGAGAAAAVAGLVLIAVIASDDST